jgi:predicted NodU family carbamoyl transferase
MTKRFTGFSEHYHNAGLATIDESGQVLFASQAERFSKKKNDAKIPDDMWEKYVLDTDHLSFYEDHEIKFRTRRDSRNFKDAMENRRGSVNNILLVHEMMPMIGSLPKFDQCHQHHVSHCANAIPDLGTLWMIL